MADNVEGMKDREAQAKGQRIAMSPMQERLAGAGRELKKVAGEIEAGSPIPGMEAETESKLKALYDWDIELEKAHTSPVAEEAQAIYGPDYFSSPAPYLTGASRAMAGGAGQVQDLFSAISAFKSLEGSTLSSALNMIVNFIEGQQQRDWEREKFERTEKRLWAEMGKPTTAEEAEIRLGEVTRDVEGMMNLGDLMRKYSTKVDANEILRIYNTFHSRPGDPWGIARETPESLYQLFGITPPARAPKLTPQDEGDKVGAMIKTMINEFETIPANQKGPAVGTITGRLGFAFPQAAEYEEGRRGFSGALKKLVGETGVLTDYDIQRIIGVLPAITDVPEQSKIAKDRLSTIFKEVYGMDLFGGEGKPPLSSFER